LGARSNPCANECTDDGLGGGNGKARSRGEDQPCRAAEFGAAHDQDQRSWASFETGDVDDVNLDSASHTRPQGDSANKFCNHGQYTDLRHRESARGGGGGVGVGDIVGAISKRADAECDGDQGDDPRVLVEYGHCLLRWMKSMDQRSTELAGSVDARFPSSIGRQRWPW
jgi:hypothetical protein